MTTPNATTPRVELHSCRDCGVQPSERHEQGCDVARCVSTGYQWIQCPGENHEYNGTHYGEHDGICQPEIWTGQWPGEMEAIEFGWYSYFGPDQGERGRGWVECDDNPTHPGATPDLNRLRTGRCIWNVELQRWVLR